MKLANLNRAIWISAVIAFGVETTWFATEAAAQGRGLPTFEVVASWAKVPDKWKLGDASSFAIDAQDNVWLLHRPRTLKGDQSAMAAPPVVVFDSAGNFIKAWGG